MGKTRTARGSADRPPRAASSDRASGQGASGRPAQRTHQRPAGRQPAPRGGRPQARAAGAAHHRPASRPPRRPSRAVILRRRIMVLLALLGVLALLVWGVTAVVRLIGDGGGPVAAVKELVSNGSSEDSGEAGDASTVADGPVQPEDCAPVDLDATVAPDGGAGGGAVALAVTLTNHGELPCLLDAGSASLVVTVTSGEDRVWSSGDCGSGPAERRLLLDVGDAAETTVTWDRVRSEPGCPGGQRSSGAGTYKVEARLGTAALPASVATFALG